MFRKLATVIALTTCSLGFSEDVWQEYRPRVETAVRAYIKAHAKLGEQERWNKNMADRISDSERTLSTIALDWFFDHEADLQRKLENAMLEACFFFMEFVRTNTPPPLQMRDRMTAQNFED